MGHPLLEFLDPATRLRSATQGLERLLVVARVSKTVVPVFVPAHRVMSEQLVVFAYDDTGHLGLLTSAMHWWWAHAWCSTMRSAGLRYSPTDAFETFPQPELQAGAQWQVVVAVGEALDAFRANLMLSGQVGLTKTYNRVHNPDDNDSEIVRLRELHIELDHAVRDAYGWSDLELDHHHWETPQGMRFTVGPAAKDELLDRLLELNQERYAAEVAAGLHDKKAKKAPSKRNAKATDPSQRTLL